MIKEKAFIIKKYFFPEKSRGFKGKRWLDISLRSIHLMGLLGVAGGFIFHVEESIWLPYFVITLISGFAMVMLSLWTHGKWLLQNRGLAIIFKLFLFIIIPVTPGYETFLLLSIVLISGVSSHAPAKFRYYSPFYGRQI